MRPLIVATALALSVTILATIGVSAHDHAHETFAAGAPGDPAEPARDVTITITENPDGTMVFRPASVDTKRGEQVRFAITNTGKAPHEFRLDDASGNAAHKAMMREMPGMMHHDPNATSIAPGATVQLLWRFSKPGAYEFACLIPGHYEAGMHGTIVVSK